MITWTVESIDKYMKALASEARALKRKGWTEDEMLDEVAYAMERAGLFEF